MGKSMLALSPRPLLFSIDPLAALAETQKQLHDRLMEVTPTSNENLKEAWQAAVEEKMQNWKESRAADPGPAPREIRTIPLQSDFAIRKVRPSRCLQRTRVLPLRLLHHIQLAPRE